jgi:hypothetical protein
VQVRAEPQFIEVFVSFNQTRANLFEFVWLKEINKPTIVGYAERSQLSRA